MRTGLLVIAMMVVGTSAYAAPKPAKPKPLPAGMKVVTKLGRPYIQQGQMLVALRDDDVADYEKIGKAELSPDGKTVEVTSTRCKGELVDDVTKVPLSKIQARLDNAAGLVAHGKKQYTVAITKFGAALQKDPETPAYATNLLAAQLLGKKTALAGQTLVVQGRKNTLWFAWRIAVDADLAGATALKGAADLISTKPGTATLAKLGENDLATTTIGGGMAALRTLSVGSPGTSEIDVVSLSTGKLLARLPLVALEDACDETTESPCDDAAKGRIAERAKLVDNLFVALGFEIASKAFIDVRNGEPVTKNGVEVEIHDDYVLASRNGNEKRIDLDGGVWAIALTPTALVIKQNRRNLYGCNDGSSRLVGVGLALP